MFIFWSATNLEKLTKITKIGNNSNSVHLLIESDSMKLTLSELHWARTNYFGRIDLNQSIIQFFSRGTNLSISNTNVQCMGNKDPHNELLILHSVFILINEFQ